MNKQNEGNQFWFGFFFLAGLRSSEERGHSVDVLAEPDACFALMQGCGAGIGWWWGGRKQSKPEKNPSELLSSPFSVNGRDTSLWELQWGMGLAEGVGRSRARPYNHQQLLFSSPFSVNRRM